MKLFAIALALAILAAPSGSAQSTSPPPADTAPSLPDSRLFHRSDLYVLTGFGAATAAMFPLDRHLASVVRDEDLVTNRTLKRVAAGFRFMGGPGPLVIGAAMYVTGRATHNRRMAELAVHGTEALFVGVGTTFALKTVLGRARPYTSADTNPHSFGLGRGFRSADYQSFPSGHTTAAFSVAAAVTSETHDWWPQYTWLIGTVMYGGATLVGMSRMYDDKHWASDVAIGAAVGTFAGLKTVRFNHTHTGNRMDRWLLGGASSKKVNLRLTAGADRTIGVVGNLRW